MLITSYGSSLGDIINIAKQVIAMVDEELVPKLSLLQYGGLLVQMEKFLCFFLLVLLYPTGHFKIESDISHKNYCIKLQLVIIMRHHAFLSHPPQ